MSTPAPPSGKFSATPRHNTLLGKKTFLEDTTNPVLLDLLTVDLLDSESGHSSDTERICQFPERSEFEEGEKGASQGGQAGQEGEGPE